MPSEWLAEGFRQLHVAARVQACVRRLQKEEATASLAEKLRVHVLTPLLECEWLPGALDFVNELPEEWTTDSSVTAGMQVLERHFTAAFPSKALTELLRKGESDSSKQREAVRELFNETVLKCRESQWRGHPENTRGRERDPIEIVASEDRVKAWLGEARALYAWESLRVEVRKPAPEAAAPAGPASELEEKCAQLVDIIDRRNDQGFFGHLVRLHSPRDYKLFESLRETLMECREALHGGGAPQLAQDDPGMLPDLFRDVPERWPPRLLARLLMSPAAAGLRNALESHLSAGEATTLLRDQEKTLNEYFRSQPLPRGVLARILLLAGVVVGLDKARVPPTAEGPLWHAVSVFADGLFAGVDLSYQILRVYDESQPSYCEKPQERPGLPREQVERTGLRVQSGSHPFACCLRKLKVVRPPPLPKAAQALKDLERWLLRRSDHAALVQPCREWEGRFIKLSTPEESRQWWTSQATMDDRGELWWFLQRLSLLGQAEEGSLQVVLPVLTALEEHGFYLDSPARMPDVEASAAAPDHGPWFLLHEPNAGAPMNVEMRSGPVLCSPTGKFAPSVWFRVFGTASGTMPLVDFAAQAERQLASLKAADPTWQGWHLYNEQLREACTKLGQGGVDSPNSISGEDRKRAHDWFTRLYHRSHDEEITPELRDRYGKLACLFHRQLPRFGVRLQPALVEKDGRLGVPPLKTLTPPDAVVELAAAASSPHPLGTVLRVLEFGSAAARPRLLVSQGKGLPAQLRPWLELPPLAEATGGKPLGPHLLMQWRRTAQALLFQPQQVAAQMESCRVGFGQWLQSQDGADWFNLLAKRATAQAGPERQWLTALVRERWCECYPQIDPTSGNVSWPSQATVQLPLLDFSFEPQKGHRRITSLQRFASKMEAAQGTVNVSRSDQDQTQLGLLQRLHGRVQSEPWLQRHLLGDLRALVAATVDQLDGTGKPQPLPEMLKPVLARLVNASSDRERPQDGLATLDAILDACRHMAGQAGHEILPTSWKYSEPPRYDELNRDEVDVKYGFHGGQPGTAAILEFSLCRTGERTRKAVARVTLGVEPRNFELLNGRLCELSASDVAELKDHMSRWAKAALGSESDFYHAALDFYRVFYGSAGRGFRERDPKRFEDMEVLLEELFRDRFQWSMFKPQSLHDFEKRQNWVLCQNKNSRDGTVTRVIQPGLFNADRELVEKAIVEAS